LVLACEESELNVDPFVQLQLLDLQRIDSERDRIAHRVRTLPEAAAARELAAEVADLRDAQVEAQTQLSDLQREQSRADADVDLVRQRIAKDQALLDSGSINDPKQLENLQHELQSLGRRQSDLEDVELEIMERVEQADAAVRAGADTLGQRSALLAETEAARDAATAALAADDERLAAERVEVAAGLPADLLGLYEKLRADNAGVGAAALHRGCCQGCQLELTATDIARIRSAASNELLRCEECRRILVRTADSGL
jgi:predicted  nucleic acid-binding Zn-ribbon protein